jgi:putative ABC transport system permease protein
MLFLKILFKNAFRHKLRTGLTILGITIAILAFGLLQTILTAWNISAETSSPDRLVTRNAIAVGHTLPLSYLEKIRQVEGVRTATPAFWFGGVYKEPKNFFPKYCYQAAPFLELYPEYILTSEEKEAFIRDRKGCLVGRKTAERFGWQRGDTVTIDGTIYTGKWDFTIRGIYEGREPSTDETIFIFQYDYLNETMKQTVRARSDRAGFYIVGLKNADSAPEVSMAIDRMFENSDAETHTESEKSFQKSFISMAGSLILAVEIISYLIIFVIMAVVANTMVMTTRERIGEYAILKTLGFRAQHISTMIIGESFVITYLGCFLGMILTFPMANVFYRAVGPIFPVFVVQGKSLILDIVMAFFVAMIAALIPTWNAVNIRIVEGLRGVR